MLSKSIKILIVDDSPLFRTMLQNELSKVDGFEVIATAMNAADALVKIKQNQPDVITLDNEMPGQSGVEFLKTLLPQYPIPCIVVTGSAMNAFDAVNNGAVDFIKKPSAQEMQQFIKDLSGKIRIAKISRIRRLQTSPAPATGASGSSAQAAAVASGPSPVCTNMDNNKIIAIGASTGGTEAIIEVVKNLPANSPGIVIVQHMPAGFTKMYAERLDKICHMSCVEATEGERVQRGKIILGAGEYHLRLAKDSQGYYVHSQRGDKVSGHCPSVDVLFDSVADVAGRNCCAAILTGMGQDGAKGMLKLRKAGGYTIGQDKETCVVYGMPMVAYNIGGVIKQMPLDKIGAELINMINKGW